jgi:pentatricopeptide repeat protein
LPIALQMIMVFLAAKQIGEVPSSEAYAAMLKSCALYGDVECAEMTLKDMRQNGVVCPP